MLLTMLKLMVALALLGLVTGTQCPNQQLCGDKHTCCQVLSSGEYNCCPFPQGECCEDHLHCCPAGMLCQTAESKCQNSTHSLSWTERKPAQAYLAKSFRMISSSTANKDNIICPDNSSCPPEFSCLKLTDKYGCCPVTQGIVCADRNHCCPNDHECSADSISCVKKAEPVMCPDGVSECPVQTTCCPTTDGGWGCCPMPRAVCCADKVHCCPENSVCHVNSSKCVSSTNKELPMWAKFPARLRADWENHRPVAVTPKLTNKQPKTSTALKSTTTNKTRNATVSTVYNVPCDDTVACADGTTCCKNGEGGWSCCPLPQAVCCDDFIHCCPHGKKCNLAAGTCEDPSGSVPWMKKLPSQPIKGKKLPETKGSDVPCNDTVACPDETTCCKNGKGGWNCCPLPQAVCCDDFQHCCPHGKKCNVAAGTCEDLSGSVPWIKKVPSRPIGGKKLPKVKGADVPCNATFACEDETTCCKNDKGGWSCCPLPEAVCCEDFLHCCPHGKKCNLAAMTCDDPSGSIPWLEKKPSRPIGGQNKEKGKAAAANVSCDSSHFCPASSTCCKDVNAEWSCCPFPQGVCCEDRIHCCPHDATCNLRTLTCDKNTTSVPMAGPVKASGPPPPEKKKPKENKANEPVKCDDHHSCPDQTTCCFMNKTMRWGCCPLPKAVCCEDGEHCCPAQYKCDKTQTSCIKGDVVIPWYNKLAAESSPDHSVDQSAVKCDSQTSCPAGTTCCEISTGKWGCCPLPEATCCPDREHCCPKGYSCDVNSQSCVKTILLQVETIPLTYIRHLQIPCGGGISCSDTETCCKTSKTTWGCCPSPKAVCCSDMKHCCPAGYTCEANGSCTQATGFNWDNWSVFFSRKKRALLV
ncbi:granulin a isoform X9 [Astyanax mexicanus]|uniref:granulin a isoform X9 n=1 Tax=Astyanax mexicanus TaxID=7994 RepID=UPI0020CACAF7|nr:granulin a isoform X9 [Astyanax mexicanus]